MSKGKMIVAVILIILGLYLLLDHTASPINHEAVGLGTDHPVHSAIGIILIIIAIFIWFRGRKSKPTAAPAEK